MDVKGNSMEHENGITVCGKWSNILIHLLYWIIDATSSRQCCGQSRFYCGK